MIDVDVGGGTPGSRLHGNPMYSGRAMSSSRCRSPPSGRRRLQPLDEYERLMRTKATPLPPFGRASTTANTSAGTGAR